MSSFCIYIPGGSDILLIFTMCLPPPPLFLLLIFLAYPQVTERKASCFRQSPKPVKQLAILPRSPKMRTSISQHAKKYPHPLRSCGSGLGGCLPRKPRSVLHRAQSLVPGRPHCHWSQHSVQSSAKTNPDNFRNRESWTGTLQFGAAFFFNGAHSLGICLKKSFIPRLSVERRFLFV